MGIPFGKHSQFAMENGPFMNDLPSYKMVIFKNGGSFHSYVKLLEGTSSWCGPNTVTNRESQRHATSGQLRSCDISGLVGVPFLPADVPHLPFAQIAGDGLTRRFKRPDNTRRSTKLSTLHINSIRHIYYGNLWYMIIMIIMI
jgi:hypothetical protein